MEILASRLAKSFAIELVGKGRLATEGIAIAGANYRFAAARLWVIPREPRGDFAEDVAALFPAAGEMAGAGIGNHAHSLSARG